MSLEKGQKTAGAGALARVEMDELTGEQRTAMELLLAGKSLAETARTAGVSRNAVYRWLKNDAAFKAIYNEWHEAMKESCRSRLKMMLDKATSAVEKALEAGDARSALALLKGMGMIEKEGERSTEVDEVARENATKNKQRKTKLFNDEMSAEFGV
jgi:predicted DNA-binding protein YlxM (UPF0122 family)